LSLIAPWTIQEYPGQRRLLAGWCQVSVATVDDWLYRGRPVPPHHARRWASMARDRAWLLNHLAEDLDRHAEARERINAKHRFKPQHHGG
jgi:hypothetical protein